MSAEREVPTFICLLADEEEAYGLARLLESLAEPTECRAVFLVPDVRGRAFFAAAELQDGVDRWWRANVSRTARPVYLLEHEEGLAPWLRGLDGMVIVAADPPHDAEYTGCVVVSAQASDAALALAHQAIVRFSVDERSAGTPAGAVFDRGDASMIASIRADPPPSSRGGLPVPSLLDVDDAYVPEAVGAPTADPLELLVAESALADSASPVWDVPPATPGLGRARRRAAVVRRRLPRLSVRAGEPTALNSEMAARLLARSPTLVVIGSRKGGVGKTSHAAGIAIVAGQALDTIGHRAAIVDANIANPDAWGHLNLPPGAATVRDVVGSLVAGREPPAPVHAVTPALACYPEGRHGVEYSRTDIRRLSAYLRARHAFTVVDMSNRLPDPMSGPEAAVAAFWLEEADALVLPTATSRQDFNGVLDYLDIPGLPPTVVPCIRSASRRNREHPTTRHFLAAIAARVERVVEIPDDADSIRLAGMSGVPVQEVSRRMGAAYRELTTAVALLPVRSRRPS